MRNLFAISALAIAITQIASADSFTIDRDNLSGVLCSTANPCGTITVTGTSTLHVAVSLNSGYGIFGNKDAFGFNTTGSTSGVSITNLSSSLFTGNGGSGNEDGWGSFAFRIDGPGGSSAVQTLSFDVTRSGNPFTGPSNIEAGATGGNGSTIFGLHIRNMSTGQTGYAGVDPVTAAPEPTSLALLGSGCAALGFFRKRRKQA